MNKRKPKTKKREAVVSGTGIRFVLNGKPVTCRTSAHTMLLELLRDVLGLKGTKPGCHEGECGACTVLVDNKAVNSCLYPAVLAEGKSILTIEGLGSADGALDAVQKALVEEGAVQCGFCTPGMVMSIKAMLAEYEALRHVPGETGTDVPSRDEIRKRLEGNLCRCTGYVKIIDAVEKLFANEE